MASLRGVRFVVVALHLALPAHQDFAVCGDGDFGVGEEIADRADALMMVGAVDGNDVGFRQAVAFQDLDADAQEEFRRHGVEGSAAGNAVAQPAARDFLRAVWKGRVYRQ